MTILETFARWHAIKTGSTDPQKLRGEIVPEVNAKLAVTEVASVVDTASTDAVDLTAQEQVEELASISAREQKGLPPESIDPEKYSYYLVHRYAAAMAVAEKVDGISVDDRLKHAQALADMYATELPDAATVVKPGAP